jgi:hypothetical protein
LNNIFIRQIFFSVFILSFNCAHAQSYETVINKFNAAGNAEKIYIQYDKDYYVSGETIWFKSYLYNNGKPSGASSNFYLQFTNSKGEIIRNQKYPVAGATVSGSVAIPDSLPQGNYHIKAFTLNMLNSDGAFYYYKNIFVFGQNSVAPPVENGRTITVSFFPESGHLVDGILTTVAFKATDQWGQPVDVNGIIKTEEGTTVAPFQSGHDGIGKVPVKPAYGKKYIAELETASGKWVFALPEVQQSGINLKLTDEPGGKKFQLSRGAKDKHLYDVLRLVVTENYTVIYENEIAFEDYPSVIGHILTGSLPSGILHFTVFDKENRPLAERLAFVDNGEYRSAGKIEIIKKGIGKREENLLEVSFSDSLQRSMSVAVVDYSSVSNYDAENIFSRFLLTADLKGYIYNPAWYFEKQSDTTKQALDNLMLTHGWSRYNWTKMLAGQYPEQKYKDEILITVRGLVTDKNNKPLNGGRLNIFLDAADVLSQPYTANVGDDGYFILDSMVYRGNGEFFYAYTDRQEKPREAVIVISKNRTEDEVFRFIQGSPPAATAKRGPTNFSNDDLQIRKKLAQDIADENVKVLKNVEVTSTSSGRKAADAVNEKYTTGVFRSPGKETIDNINEPPTDKAQNGVDFVKNRIQQLVLDGNRFTNRKNFSLLTGQRWTVGVFINEQPADVLQLRLLRADEIALIKFYEAGFVGTSSTAPGGALAVYTKERKIEPRQDDKLQMFEYPGYTIIREFYNPDYSVPDKQQPPTDKRTTLFWAPVLFTGAGTKTIPLRFLNNDYSKKLRVIAEGFDVNGKLVHLETVVE